MSLYNRYMYIGKYSETQVVSWVWLVVDELDRCIHTYSPNYHDGQVDHCIINRHERVTVNSGFYVKMVSMSRQEICGADICCGVQVWERRN